MGGKSGTAAIKLYVMRWVRDVYEGEDVIRRETLDVLTSVVFSILSYAGPLPRQAGTRLRSVMCEVMNTSVARERVSFMYTLYMSLASLHTHTRRTYAHARRDSAAERLTDSDLHVPCSVSTNTVDHDTRALGFSQQAMGEESSEQRTTRALASAHHAEEITPIIDVNDRAEREPRVEVVDKRKQLYTQHDARLLDGAHDGEVEMTRREVEKAELDPKVVEEWRQNLSR
eukprot:6200185-Pleurochrysis_carterae.AAC.1